MAIVDTQDIRCLSCGHMPHPPNGCLNMASDDDCNCKAGTPAAPTSAQEPQEDEAWSGDDPRRRVYGSTPTALCMDVNSITTTIPAQAEPELLPCPFCGKESSGQEFGPGPYLSRSQNSQFKSVICSGCCSIAAGETESRVIERWNTRATPIPEVEAALKELGELFPKASWREVRFVEESGLKVTIAFNNYSSGYSSTFSGSSLAEALSAVREWKDEQ